MAQDMPHDLREEVAQPDLSKLDFDTIEEEEEKVASAGMNAEVENSADMGNVSWNISQGDAK